MALPFNQWSNLGAPMEAPANLGRFQFIGPKAAINVLRDYRW